MRAYDTVDERCLRLHRYLVDNHWIDGGLVGPDPGIRFDYRIGRFIKSYSRISWNRRLYYLQGQAYWVLGNWALFAQTGAEEFADIALRTSLRITDSQRTDGAWDYPNPEWSGRVATNEGTWASMALIESYRQSARSEFIDAAQRWHRFLLEETRFQQVGDQLSINYFAGRQGARVPNNSVTVIRFLAELNDVDRTGGALGPLPGLLAFIKASQKDSGEFPYSVDSSGLEEVRSHFQCYQYNAFEVLNLLRFYELSREPSVAPVIERCVQFLQAGVVPGGFVRYQCGSRRRRVTYHAAALGAALVRASRLGFGDHMATAERVFEYVNRQQRSDGGFPHSRGEYGILSDRTAYPRYLAMILYHLLHTGDIGLDPPARELEVR